MGWRGLGVLVVGACGATPEEVEQPTVAIVAPVEGAQVTGDTLVVRLEVTDFTFSRDDATAWWQRRSPLAWLVPTAHAHEVGEAANGYARLTVDEVEAARALEPEVTLDVRSLAPGAHELRVELFYPDGDSFFPAVADVVTVQRP
ncbi:MAG: hypothetical protein H6732_11055 [Alphaproteobacteria bacterium]|nr:hypothetical protein [Alphaproteobacteria bacterium]